eukprot:UN33404
MSFDEIDPQSAFDLGAICHKHGIEVFITRFTSIKDFRDQFGEADNNNDGLLNYEEFCLVTGADKDDEHARKFFDVMKLSSTSEFIHLPLLYQRVYIDDFLPYSPLTDFTIGELFEKSH